MQKEKQIKKISSYILFKKIGQGTTAEVYQAYSVLSNKYAAVKVFSFHKNNIEQMTNSLNNELKLLSTFSHNNITKIETLMKTTNNLYVILEYCNGKTLNHYKTTYYQKYKKQLPEEIVQKILKQIIQGLSFIHQSKCVHRDIKLDNILLNFDNLPNVFMPNSKENDIPIEKKYSIDEPFTVKIADLGFAKVLNERNITSTICGTPITMAPEVFNWTEHIDQSHFYNEKADLWSLGAITYELLIGKPPFIAEEQNQLFQLIKEGRYFIPKEMTLSIEAISFINELLQFYPDKRMDWPQILNHPFITKEYNGLHFINLERVSCSNGNDKNIEFNAKSKNDFDWLIPNSSYLDNELNKDNDDINNNPIDKNDQEICNKIMITGENDINNNEKQNELIKQMIEENNQLKKTIAKLKSALQKKDLSKYENEELKKQIKNKTEENEKLNKEIQSLQIQMQKWLIHDNYFSSNNNDIKSNDRMSFDWELINSNTNTNDHKNKPHQLDMVISIDNCNNDLEKGPNRHINCLNIINEFY